MTKAKLMRQGARLDSGLVLHLLIAGFQAFRLDGEPTQLLKPLFPCALIEVIYVS
jgi:hypothetical protein